MTKRGCGSFPPRLLIMLGWVVFFLFGLQVSTLAEKQSPTEILNNGDNQAYAFQVIGVEGGSLQLDGARIIIPPHAVATKTSITIERLTEQDLPPLNAGLVNVTRNGGGYRFLPKGMNFQKEILVEIPVEQHFQKSDSEPPTFVRNFYWDEVTSNWVPLPRGNRNEKRENESNKNFVSRTTHFTTMISGILTAPDQPAPLQFNPNSIKDIATADPTAGVDLIAPPTPNNQGTATLTYPIQIPKGRGQFSPQIRLVYSSAQSNGWVGVGWDLSVPQITIDTRWGVPAYDGKERYLINGDAVVPIKIDAHATCKFKSGATPTQYATRNESFQRILRCREATGDDTISASNWWEVTTKDGTRFEYGTNEESRLTSYHQDELTHTAVWYLRRVVDPNQNSTYYHYSTDSNESAYKGEPFVQRYLNGIEYTSHPQLRAAYFLSFNRDCSSRKDPIITARTGFKVVTRCRLDRINVEFENPTTGRELIRSYKLGYGDGAFGKSVLKTIQVHGSDSTKFYEHSMEYTEPEFAQANANGSPFQKTAILALSETESSNLRKPDSLITHTEETSDDFTFGLGAKIGIGVGETGVGCEIGVSAGFNIEESIPRLRHLDLNGDGISDRIWLWGDEARVALAELTLEGQANEFVGTLNGFPLRAKLPTLGSGDSIGGLLGSNVGCNIGPASVNAGRSVSMRYAATYSTLADADGDGRIDFTSGTTFQSGGGTSCRDGQQPGPSGECTDGIPACPESHEFCFGQSTALIANPPPVANQSLYGLTSPLPTFQFPSDEKSSFSLRRVSNNNRLPQITNQLNNPPQLLPESISGRQLRAEEGWGPYTSLRKRLSHGTEMAGELYRLDPVIRWDAWHDGVVNITAQARRKHLGGSDGVEVTLLYVTDAMSPSGTHSLGKPLTLAPNDARWHAIPGSGSHEINFGESILVILDTLDDVPVSEEGILIDEVELQIHIEYKTVCPPHQPCRDLKPHELNHRDITGQLSYVFDFPKDVRAAELPRLDYWHLLPPVGPPRSDGQGNVEHNRITGKIRKMENTSSPVHVRIRCESVASQQANDKTICPLGTILHEEVFEPEEIGERKISKILPSPFRPVFRIVGTRQDKSGNDQAFIFYPGQSYEAPELLEIGTLGGLKSYANDMNAIGQVVGWSTTQEGYQHAFVWSPERGMLDLTPHLKDIEDRPIDKTYVWRAQANGINAHGAVVGEIRMKASYSDSETEVVRTQAFFWTPKQGLIFLNTLGGVSSKATAINDLGQIVGASQTSSGVWHAVIWTFDNMVGTGNIDEMKIPKMLNTTEYNKPRSNERLSMAYDINNRGQIVGSSTFNHESHAVLWSIINKGKSQSQDIVKRDLGTLGGGKSTAYGINERGDIVGVSYTPSRQSHPFLWRSNETEGIATNPQMKDLLPDHQSTGTAHAINEHGQIVGHVMKNGQWNMQLWTINGEGINETLIAPNARGGGITGTYQYEPIRLLYEIDGENGREVPPEAIEWKPLLNVVSVHDLKEVKRPSPEKLKIAFNESPHGMAKVVYAKPEKQIMIKAPTESKSRVTSLNDQDQLVGSIIDANGSRTATLWTLRKSKATTTQPSIIKLKTLGGNSSEAQDINRFGQVVGWSEIKNGNKHGFFWQVGASTGVKSNPQMVDLGTLPHTSSSQANAINDRGYVVGGSGGKAFIWAGGHMLSLGSLPQDKHAVAWDINNNLQIVGDSSLGFGSRHAVLWEAKDGDGDDQEFLIRDLGSLSGERGKSSALAINENSQIVGYSSVQNDGREEIHAFIWFPRRTQGVITDGAMRDLHTLGGSLSVAYDINEQGEVAGYSTSADGKWHAFIWSRDKGMVDLGLINDVSIFDKNLALRNAITTDFIKQDSPVYVNPERSWVQKMPVLYRVHPSRQLLPFRTTNDNRELQVTVTMVNGHNPLNVTVSGEAIHNPGTIPEGELGRLVINPEEQSSVVRYLVTKNSHGTFNSDLASEWGSSRNGLVWGFELKKNVLLEAGPSLTIKNIKKFLDANKTQIDGYEKSESYEDEFFYLLRIELNNVNPKLLEQISQLGIPSGYKTITKIFNVRLPNPGLYYVRGYTEAGFDPASSIDIRAKLIDSPQLLIVNKELARQTGGIEEYQKLNRSHIRIYADKGSPAYFAALKLFPNAQLLSTDDIEDVEGWNPSDEELPGLIAQGFAHAAIGDAEALARSLSNFHELTDYVYLCCHRNTPTPIFPEVPTNVLKPLFGDTYQAPRKYSLEIPGEVWYSFDAYGGGHHGFFYGQFNGEEELICIGAYPCSENSQVGTPAQETLKVQKREVQQALNLYRKNVAFQPKAESVLVKHETDKCLLPEPSEQEDCYLTPDECARDTDADGIPDCVDSNICADSIGMENNQKLNDQDGDGIPDCVDLDPGTPENFNGKDDHDGRPETTADADNDDVFDDHDLCPFSPGSVDGCPPDFPPTDPNSADQLVDLSPGGEDGKKSRRYMPTHPKGKDESSCFVGGDPSVRICPDGGVHPSRKGSVPPYATQEEDDSEDDENEDNGKSDPLQRSWTFGLTGYFGGGLGLDDYGIPGGISFGAQLGVGSTWMDTDYMDWNGDGVPDLLSPNIIRLSGMDVSVALDLPCYIENPFDDNEEESCLLYPGIREQVNTLAGLNFGLSGRGGGQFDYKTSSGGRTKGQGWSDLNFGLNTHTSQSFTTIDRIDINGDGLPDIVVAEPDGDKTKVRVRLNLGYRVGDLEDWGTIDLPSTAGLGKLAEKLGNGFKQQPAIEKTENFTVGVDVGVNAIVNFGIFGGGFKGGRKESVTLSQARGLLTDINQDGLPDLIFKNPNSDRFVVRINRGGLIDTGGGTAFLPKTDYTIDHTWQTPPRIPETRSILAGQSVTDWISQVMKEPPDALSVTGSEMTNWSGTIEVTVFFITGSFSYANSSGASFVEMSMQDATGDGLVDRVLRTGNEANGAIQIQANRFGGANLLKAVHRPFGGQIELHYTKQFSSEADPNTRWVLSGSTLKNEDTFPAAHKTTPIKFEYTYSKPYYDRIEREFFGFENVKTIRADDRITEDTYANRDYRLKGLAVKTEVKDFEEKIYQQVSNIYEPTRRYPGQAQSAERVTCLSTLPLPLSKLANQINEAAGTSPCDVWFAKPTSLVTRHYEGGETFQETAIHFEAYDEFGNVTRIRDLKNEGPTDDMVAVISYDHQEPFLQSYVTDRVKSIDVRQGEITGQPLRYREATYDNHGNLLTHSTFIDSGGNERSTLQLEYDTLGTGFVTAITDPVGYQVHYTPDGIINQFAMRTEDSFGLTSSGEYDFRYQFPIKQTDSNKNVQIFAYDAYGRLESVAGPYEFAANKQSLSLTYAKPDSWKTSPVSAIATNLAVIPDTTTVSTEIHLVTFIDGLGRTIQQQSDASVEGKVGRIVSGKIEFDEIGRLKKQAHPVFRPGINPRIENTTFVPKQFSDWQYDTLDRPMKVMAPGDLETIFRYDITGHPRQGSQLTQATSIIDPEKKERIEYRDAIGRLVAVGQLLDGREIVTSYAYHTTGELLTITDAREHQTQMAYDLAGRRIAITTPDTGRLELGYDLNGNLIEKTDQVLCPQSNSTALLSECQENQKIRYIRDKNRLLSINYPTLPTAHFTYGDQDPNGECQGQMNIQGRVCKVTNEAGSEFRSYGALGEVVETRRLMQGAAWEQNDREFSTSYKFDSFGRLLELTYPDGERLTYQYNQGGLPYSVAGQKGSDTTSYVSQILYDEFGKQTLMEYGNGVVTTNNYEPDTRRLANQEIKSIPQNEVIRTIHYEYDRVGNIRSQSENRLDAPPFLRKMDKQFSYDDLHRLVTSSMRAEEAATDAGEPQSVSTAYTYDQTGNILTQMVQRRNGAQRISEYPTRNWTYGFDQIVRPNLPHTIGPYEMTYDARGALTQTVREEQSDAPRGLTLQWNDEGRLAFSTRQDEEVETGYIYDTEGQRTRKQTPALFVNENEASDTTIYPNEFYTARFAQSNAGDCDTSVCWDQVTSRTKHVYINNMRAAVKAFVVNPGTATSSDEALEFLSNLIQFFHAEPVGSTALTTNDNGFRVKEIDYLPFGEVLFAHETLGGTALPAFYGFNGKEFDHETGFTYFGARYYNSIVGRWTAPDLLYMYNPELGKGDPLAFNLFAFAIDNPVRINDPRGNEGCDTTNASCSTPEGQYAWSVYQLYQHNLKEEIKRLEKIDPAGGMESFFQLDDVFPVRAVLNKIFKIGKPLGKKIIEESIGEGAEKFATKRILPAATKTTADAMRKEAAERGLTLTNHVIERLIGREAHVTLAGVEKALRHGAKFVDPKNGTVVHILEGGLASGKSLLVSKNPETGAIVTVISGNIKSIMRPRFLPLE